MKRFLVIGAVGLLLILIALGLSYWLAVEDAPAPPAPISVVPTPAPVEPAPQQPVAPSTARQPADILPEFDVVRVASTGDAVIAGRAAPGAQVTVHDGDGSLGMVAADSRGEWVLVPGGPLSPGTHELRLSSQLADGREIWSEKSVVVVVPEQGKDIAGRPATEPASPLAVEVPSQGFDASKVLQQPPADVEIKVKPAPGEPTMRLTVDVLDYDEAGNLALSGGANPDSEIRVYLDNEALGAAVADAAGAWKLIVSRHINPGLYTVRVDETVADKVIARLEFPFSRADPQIIAAGNTMVVVQPGNSLWRIARRTLGEGTRYTVIFEANRDRIRDPDLIYPGQILEVPGAN